VRIVTLSGSLRAASTNTALLEACHLLVPAGVELQAFRGVAELPHFNPDVEATGLPAAVAAFRDEITQADGILISSPEYARGIPGALKNALDWLVGHPPFAGKPVAVFNASPRSIHATAQLLEVLTTMSAHIVRDALITLPLMGTGLGAAEIAADPKLCGPARQALLAFVSAIEQQAGTT
jgi:chromate reductase, NAD(P)H dehydrogenase (quinone)